MFGNAINAAKENPEIKDNAVNTEFIKLSRSGVLKYPTIKAISKGYTK